MSKVKVLTVLRSRVLKNTNIASKALNKEGSGMLWTFSAEGFTTTLNAIDSLEGPVMLDNGAYLSREIQDVLAGNKHAPPYFASIISRENVEYFVEPDIVAPENFEDALERSVAKANAVYRYLDEDSLKKAVRPIQGQRVSAHMRWFKNYRPSKNPDATNVAFGGLGAYDGSDHIRKEVTMTSRILVREFGVTRIHLLGSTSVDTIHLAEEISDFANEVTFDSSTISYSTYGNGDILIPTHGKNSIWLKFRRRFEPFSDLIQNALDNCPCEACKCVRFEFTVPGIATLIETQFLYTDPPDVVIDLIFLHNAENFAVNVKERLRK